MEEYRLQSWKRKRNQKWGGLRSRESEDQGDLVRRLKMEGGIS
jgi:hypothetical protein